MLSKRRNLTNFIRNKIHRKYSLHSRNFGIKGMSKPKMPNISWNLDIIDHMRLSIIENRLKDIIKN